MTAFGDKSDPTAYLRALLDPAEEERVRLIERVKTEYITSERDDDLARLLKRLTTNAVIRRDPTQPHGAHNRVEGKRLRKLLRASGVLPADADKLADGNCLFDAERGSAAAREAATANLSVRKAGLYLNAPRIQLYMLYGAGLLVPRISGSDHGAKDKFAPEDLDAFLDRLLDGAAPVKAIALLGGHVAFPLAHPERRPFVAAGGLDFQQALLAVGFERLDIVAVAIAVEVGHPSDRLGQVIPACFFQPAPLESNHELLAGLAQVPVAGVPGSGIELSDQAPDGRRTALRIAVEERRRRHQDVVLVRYPQRACGDRHEQFRMQEQLLLHDGDERVLIVRQRLVALDPRHPDLVQDGGHVLQLPLDRSRLAPYRGDHAAAILRLVVVAAGPLLGKHQEIAADQHGDLVRRPVGALLARIDAV